MADERAPVTFRDWKERLATEPWAPAIKQQTARDIIGFLRHCKEVHAPASIVGAKGYIAQREAHVRNPEASPHAALRGSFFNGDENGGENCP